MYANTAEEGVRAPPKRSCGKLGRDLFQVLGWIHTVINELLQQPHGLVEKRQPAPSRPRQEKIDLCAKSQKPTMVTSRAAASSSFVAADQLEADLQSWKQICSDTDMSDLQSILASMQPHLFGPILSLCKLMRVHRLSTTHASDLVSSQPSGSDNALHSQRQHLCESDRRRTSSRPGR